MEEEDLLDFNYLLHPQNQIQMEIKIKQIIRDTSLNLEQPREIERYSDKYVSNVPRQDVMKRVDLSLLSTELQRRRGIQAVTERNVILDEIDEEEYENKWNNENESDNGSLEGGDDYEHNYFDDEDYIAEDNNQAEEVF